MRAILIIITIFSASANADGWHMAVGLSDNFYQKTQDTLWWQKPYANVRTSQNYGWQVEAQNQVNRWITVKAGFFQPQTHYINADAVPDAQYYGGACPSQCSAPGSLTVSTKTDGVYFMLSPEYRGLFLDIGAWYVRQSVQAQARGIPGWPPGGYMTSVGYSWQPVYGVGYRFGSNYVSVDAFDASIPDRQMLPAGFNGPIVSATFKHIF